jgi:hypothetical protein
LELEDCKREVVRERTRLIEREELRKADVSLRVAGSSRAKGKNKAKDVSGFGRPELDDEKLRTRYKEAVDEKKGLRYFLFFSPLLKFIMFSLGSPSQLTPLASHAADSRAVVPSGPTRRPKEAA